MCRRRVKNGLVVDQRRKTDGKEWREKDQEEDAWKALVVGERLKKRAGWTGLVYQGSGGAWIPGYQQIR